MPRLVHDLAKHLLQQPGDLARQIDRVLDVDNFLPDSSQVCRVRQQVTHQHTLQIAYNRNRDALGGNRVNHELDGFFVIQKHRGVQVIAFGAPFFEQGASIQQALAIAFQPR